MHPGSNAWAISGAHSATGKPLLSNDMHLEFSIPGIWYHGASQAPGMNVSGVALPGVPGIISGHNDRIAWGVTNLGFDVQDLYIEKIDMRTGRYVFQGTVEQARAEREMILVKGQAAGRECSYWVTRHGPVCSEQGNGDRASRCAGRRPNRAFSQNVFLGCGPRAQLGGVQEGDFALRRAGAEFRLCGRRRQYRLSRRGQIAHPAQILRRCSGGRLVGRIRVGWIHSFRRAAAGVQSAERTGRDGQPESLSAGLSVSRERHFASPYRSRQILNMLPAPATSSSPRTDCASKRTFTAASTGSWPGRLVAAYDAEMATIDVVYRRRGDAAELERPDGSGPPGAADYDPGVSVSAQGDCGAGFAGQRWDLRPAAVDVRDGANAAASGRPDGLRITTSFCLRCFADAHGGGPAHAGRQSKRLEMGQVHVSWIEHPGRQPSAGDGRYFDIGPVPMSGGSTTVKQTTRRLGPSERMDASLGDWDASLMNLPIGESGHVASCHYKDEWDAYYNGLSFPMQFSRIDAKSSVTFTPR